jgi:SAM-dependent methyltransferase
MSEAAEAPSFEYAGSELALFEKAVRWKRYWRAQIAPFVHGNVLEVGAGIGSNTRLLAGLQYRSWTCLEPDAALAAQIELPSALHRKVTGTIASAAESFDSILYIDVLEHIEDDAAEMARAAARLTPGGHLIVLAPAHAFLYAPFDAAVGHLRRYSRASLRSAAPAGLRESKMIYLDTVVLLASAANRLLLRQSMPTERQILTWDRLMIPLSRAIDPLLGNRLGKSVLGVWQQGRR